MQIEEQQDHKRLQTDLESRLREASYEARRLAGALETSSESGPWKQQMSERVGS